MTQASEIRDTLERLTARLHTIPAERVFNRLALSLRVRTLASLLDRLGECRLALNLPPRREAGVDE